MLLKITNVFFSLSLLVIFSVFGVCSVCNLLITNCIDALSLGLLPPSPPWIQSSFFPLSSSAKATTLFRKETKAIVWGMQTRAVQGMLDFDYVCSRDQPSVTAMVYPFT